MQDTKNIITEINFLKTLELIIILQENFFKHLTIIENSMQNLIQHFLELLVGIPSAFGKLLRP